MLTDFICDALKENGKPCGKSCKNEQGLSAHKRLAHSIFSPEKLKSEEEVLEKIQTPDLSAIEKINLAEKTLVNSTEEEKIKLQKEKNIQNLQQEVRENKALVENLNLLKLREKLEKQNPNSIDIKDLVELRKLELLNKSGNQDNPALLSLIQLQTQQFQNQIAMQQKNFDFQLEMYKKVNENKQPEKNLIEQMLDAKKVVDMMSGKNNSDDFGDKVVKILTPLMPLGQKFLEQKSQQQMQQQQNFQTENNIPRQNIPSGQINLEPVQEIMPLAPAPLEISDEDYLKNNNLSDFGYDNPSPFVNMYSKVNSTTARMFS